ncbi:hypothetical protein GGR58DRAFT_463122 [Xylaria digitata]|nr:hypothetical protein GGR58DRAFT_463122 [Xylaria digitata]
MAINVNVGLPAPLANGLQPMSCLRCARHKVRCDRLYPCARCHRNDVLCEFPQPKTERRKRRKPPAAVSSASTSTATDKLHARLDRYENLLKTLGISIEPIETLGLPQARATADSPIRHVGAHDDYVSSVEMMATNGRPIDNRSQSCFIDENLTAGALTCSPIDHKVGDARYDTRSEHKSSADSLALCLSPEASTIGDLYPSQHQFSILWQIYLDNIQPITTILHVPSTGILLAEAAKGPGCASKDSEVLLFAVMACALISITDEECRKKLGEERSILLSRHRLGCEKALVNARFLTSPSFAVLQAYTIYLSVVSLDAEPFEIWNLTSIARRNALRLGLHQERIPGLTPFEVEMRRRLWLQIIAADTTSYHAISASIENPPWPESNYKFSAPSTVNDSDLCPTMEESPTERGGVTDMIYCNLRCKILKFMIGKGSGIKLWEVPGHTCTPAVERCSRLERENAIAELEKEIELDLLRYYDILNPVHVLTVTVARLTLCKLRFAMLESLHGEHPNQLTMEDKDLMLSAALRVLEYENITYSQPSMQGFLWHTHQSFQWSCLIHILEHLKGHPHGQQVEKAWEQIRMSYDLRPNLYQMHKHKIPLCTTINQLTLEAWQVREAYAFEDGRVLVTPTYISFLREQRTGVASKQQETSSEPSSVVDSPRTPEDGSEGALLSLENFEQEIVSWTEWNNWDITSPNPRHTDIQFFNRMSSLNHDMHGYHDPGPAQGFVPSITRRNQVGDRGRQALKIQFPRLH